MQQTFLSLSFYDGKVFSFVNFSPSFSSLTHSLTLSSSNDDAEKNNAFFQMKVLKPQQDVAQHLIEGYTRSKQLTFPFPTRKKKT
jgi:hypothetical protein